MDITKTVIKYNLIPSVSRIGVAVSGGKDSIALLHYLSKNFQDFKISKLVCVNVEHGIRGEDSKRDSAFVKQFADSLGIECICFSANIPELSKQCKKGMEQTAREFRYECFTSLIKSGAVDYIATAHHKQDMAETLLMNLLRGSGARGMAGIKAIRADGIIRPLIDTSVCEIEKYVEENSLKFVIDESNYDNAYTRNFIRNELAPKISEIYPNWANSLCRFSNNISEDEIFLRSLATEYVHMNNGAFVIDSCENIPDVVFTRAIFIVLEFFKVIDMQECHIEQIKQLVRLKSGSMLNLPCGVDAYNDYGKLVFRRGESVEREDIELAFREGDTEFCENIISVIPRGSVQKGNGLFLALNKIPENAVFRFRREGDIFKRFAGGTKKLKDYLIDKKIIARERDFIPLLCSGNEVLAVIGYEISENVKVGSGDKIVEIQLIRR